MNPMIASSLNRKLLALSAALSIALSIAISFRLSILLSIRLSIGLSIGLLLLGCTNGTDSQPGETLFWGRRGLDAGRILKPRAITIDPQDRLYIADMTGRIQVFDADGKYLRGWRTPECQNGKPVGLSFSRDGHLIVCDTHYFRLLFYTPEGELVNEKTIGGNNGRGPGEFGFITDVAEDSRGNFYVGEYGDFDRIQKFSPEGDYLLEFGGHGTEPEEFLRPQGLTIDRQDFLWVADASNHRVQIYDVSGDQPRWVKSWGQQGANDGELSYPYAIWLNETGDVVWVCDMGNHRVQAFNREGEFLGKWGGPGREAGQTYQPWAFCRDSKGLFHILDTYNHRVQRFEFPISSIQKNLKAADE